MFANNSFANVSHIAKTKLRVKTIIKLHVQDHDYRGVVVKNESMSIIQKKSGHTLIFQKLKINTSKDNKYCIKALDFK